MLWAWRRTLRRGSDGVVDARSRLPLRPLGYRDHCIAVDVEVTGVASSRRDPWRGPFGRSGGLTCAAEQARRLRSSRGEGHPPSATGMVGSWSSPEPQGVLGGSEALILLRSSLTLLGFDGGGSYQTTRHGQPIQSGTSSLDHVHVTASNEGCSRRR